MIDDCFVSGALEGAASQTIEAWGVWPGWHGDIADLVAIGHEVDRLVKNSYEGVACRKGRRAVFDSLTALEAAPERSLRTFDWLRIRAGGSTSVDLSFNRRKAVEGLPDQTRGLVLRVAGAADEAKSIRDALAVPIEAGAAPLSDAAAYGEGDESFAAACEGTAGRAVSVFLVGFFIFEALFLAAEFLHKFLPEGRLNDALVYCFCRPWIALPTAFILGLLGGVVAQRVLPPVEISKQPFWRRVAVGLGTSGFVTSVASAVILNALGLKH